MNEKIESINILVVDDSDDDILITQRVFKKVRMMNTLYTVRSGEEAIDFIYRQNKYAESMPPLPGLILLDISMPGMSGFDVLKKLKADQNYRKIPIVMLTTSSDEVDIAKSYDNGACSFITKPTTFADFIKAIERFEVYWTLVTKIPK